MGWLDGKDEFGNMEVNAGHKAGLPGMELDLNIKIIVNEESRTITFKKRFLTRIIR